MEVKIAFFVLANGPYLMTLQKVYTLFPKIVPKSIFVVEYPDNYGIGQLPFTYATPSSTSIEKDPRLLGQLGSD